MSAGMKQSVLHILVLVCCVSFFAVAEEKKTAFMDSVLTEKAYYQALERADSLTFVKEFETYFLLVLSKEREQAYHEQTALSTKKLFIKTYWKASNPNPLLKQNDWLLDFNRRVAYAKENFPIRRHPFIDDRGRAWIKYGKPRSRWQEPGGGHSFKMSQQRWLIFYLVHPNEIWSYGNISNELVLFFISKDKGFNRIDDMTKLIYEVRTSSKKIRRAVSRTELVYWAWGDFVIQRAALSPVLGEAAVDAMGSIEGYSPWERPGAGLQTRAFETKYEVKRALREAPPAAYDPIYAENTLRFTRSLSQFKGPNGKTRVETVIVAPLKKNLTDKIETTMNDTLNLAFSGIMRDRIFRPFSYAGDSASFIIGEVARNKLPNAIGEVDFLAVPGWADITLQIEKRRKDRKEKKKKKEKSRGFQRLELIVRDFSGKGLMMSDLSFYSLLDQEPLRGVLPVKYKDGAQVTPYPYAKIRKSKPPLLYFEIYNILSAGAKNKFNISYTLTSIKQKHKTIYGDLVQAVKGRKSTSITTTFERAVDGENNTELFGIDLSNAKKGLHNLAVEVSIPEIPEASVKIERRIIIDN